ncbi:hypothetical protein Csa_013162 [Cucumis sativus]|uniref:Uncharacterized protein n=1 Tax=Cucumis sativus TaxID=3659 RepID=A0A0A0LXP5_CUCSA|nr:hypothetical protein Csa_013162 [Cucumis sativus]
MVEEEISLYIILMKTSNFGELETRDRPVRNHTPFLHLSLLQYRRCWVFLFLPLFLTALSFSLFAGSLRAVIFVFCYTTSLRLLS